jgi:hypothetical protein
MRPIARTVLLLWLPTVALAADDSRVTRLEQDVRTLQRDVQVLQRQLDSVRLQTTRPGADGGGTQPTLPAISANPDWVDAAKWKRLHNGMKDLEVIATLGPPSSTRDVDGSRQLLYAMEIGPASFLAGSVTLRDGSVIDVKIPTLK